MSNRQQIGKGLTKLLVIEMTITCHFITNVSWYIPITEMNREYQKILLGIGVSSKGLSESSPSLPSVESKADDFCLDVLLLVNQQ